MISGLLMVWSIKPFVLGIEFRAFVYFKDYLLYQNSPVRLWQIFALSLAKASSKMKSAVVKTHNN